MGAERVSKMQNARGGMVNMCDATMTMVVCRVGFDAFRMMGEVDARIRRGLIRATLHLVNREYAALADDFVTLGMLPKDADKEAIVPALTGVFAQALAGEMPCMAIRFHD